MDTIYAPSMSVLRGFDCSLKGSVQNSMTSLGHGTKFRTTTWRCLPLPSPEKKEKNVMVPRCNFPRFQWLFLFYKPDRVPEFPWPIRTLLFLVSSTSLFRVVSIFLDLEISYIVYVGRLILPVARGLNHLHLLKAMYLSKHWCLHYYYTLNGCSVHSNFLEQ